MVNRLGTKTYEEIQNIKRACILGDQAFRYALKKIKIGVSEKELAIEIKRFIKRHGVNISFKPIVAFGENSANVHNKPGLRTLRANEIIMIDLGAKVNGFCSDMTRTIFFGKATNKYKQIYKIVKIAQSKAVNYIKDTPKPKAKDIDKAARDYIISKGYDTIPHSLGHGVGKKVHTSPRISSKSKSILNPPVVFTIEPGIYIKGFGGIRIEDTYLLDEKGLIQLSKSTKELIEI